MRRAVLGRELEQGADGPAGLLARLELEHLAQQHEHRDDGGRLEVDRHGTVAAPKRGWKEAGQERGQDAIGPGYAGAHGDQGEHVEVAAF